MRRPKPGSQEGMIQALLESFQGQRVPLPAILDLRPRVSQYGRAIYTLRHKYGFRIENGCEEGRPDHLVPTDWPQPLSNSVGRFWQTCFRRTGADNSDTDSRDQRNVVRFDARKAP